MTSIPRKMVLPIGFRQSFVKVLQNKCLKYEDSSVLSLLFSKFFSIQVNNGDYYPPMRKRLKKNDPNMESFLNSSYVIDRIQKLSSCMNCSIEESTELMKRESRLAVVNFDELRKKIELFKFYQYSTQDLIANTAVLNRAYNVLETRLATFEILGFLPNETTLSILKYSNRKFNLYVEELHQEKKFLSLFSSKEDCIANILDCDVEKAKILLKDPKVMSFSPYLLKKKVDILKHHGFPSTIADTNIIRALVRVSILVINKRMQVLNDENIVDSLKFSPGYLLSCGQKSFEKSVATFLENQTALESCKTKKEYLMFRLKCSDKVAEVLADKRPISVMSERKLKKMLDFFLYEVTVSPEFIISNCSLLGLSLEKFQYRWPLISSSVTKDSQQISKLFKMSNEKFDQSSFARSSHVSSL